jgi:hypothetical protein
LEAANGLEVMCLHHPSQDGLKVGHVQVACVVKPNDLDDDAPFTKDVRYDLRVFGPQILGLDVELLPLHNNVAVDAHYGEQGVG